MRTKGNKATTAPKANNATATTATTTSGSEPRPAELVPRPLFTDNPAEEKPRREPGPHRTICIATSTRADWGLLSPIAHALRSRPEVTLQIIATNMHLDPARGMTVTEIEGEGFTVDRRVPMMPESDSPRDTARAMGRCLADMADALADLRPDILLLLGDRYEMLATASAATMLGIPVAHISGGEITEGAIDDQFRHAISKLSSLHFATTAGHRRRLIAMGEQPDRVYNAGALGVWNNDHVKVMWHSELEESLGIAIRRPCLLVTYHPATNDAVDPATRFSALLDALERHPEASVIFTYPNNDPRSAAIIPMIEDYVERHPGHAYAVASMGRTRYLSALRYVDAVVGNSSSGIVEVPSAHIPTVDIGMRQRGRTASLSVNHCGDSAPEIDEAISFALSDQGQAIARAAANPYANPDTVGIIVEALLATDPTDLLPKKFHDIP